MVQDRVESLEPVEKVIFCRLLKNACLIVNTTCSP